MSSSVCRPCSGPSADVHSWGCNFEGLETGSDPPPKGSHPPGRQPYLALQRAQQSSSLAEGLEEVEQVKVGQLPIESLHSHIKASDHIAAQLQGHSCLDGPSPALQRGRLHACGGRCLSCLWALVSTVV